jgi:hypothetical protein
VVAVMSRAEAIAPRPCRVRTVAAVVFALAACTSNVHGPSDGPSAVRTVSSGTRSVRDYIDVNHHWAIDVRSGWKTTPFIDPDDGTVAYEGVEVLPPGVRVQ